MPSLTNFLSHCVKFYLMKCGKFLLRERRVWKVFNGIQIYGCERKEVLNVWVLESVRSGLNSTRSAIFHVFLYSSDTHTHVYMKVMFFVDMKSAITTSMCRLQLPEPLEITGCSQWLLSIVQTCKILPSADYTTPQVQENYKTSREKASVTVQVIFVRLQ